MQQANGSSSSSATNELAVFVDGSYDAGKGGAGVYFGPNDPWNRAVPVPQAKDTLKQPMSSERAELYAACLAVYLAFDRKHTFEQRGTTHQIWRHTPVTHPQKAPAKTGTTLWIYQDCVRASVLLRSVQHHAEPPSRWTDEQKRQWLETHQAEAKHLDMASNGSYVAKLSMHDLIEFADLLNLWWRYWRSGCTVRFQHVSAHQQQPASADRYASVLWRANDIADRMAKAGRLADVFPEFMDLPLFYHDGRMQLYKQKTNATPKHYYLPLEVI